MKADRIFHRIADKATPSTGVERAVQRVLSLAAPVYGAGAWVNRILYDAGLRQRDRLPGTVFSVGNITLGGAGKTPFTMWLAKWMRAQGKRPVILSRGYGRADEDALVVVHDGKRLRAKTREGGDEPVLVARALGEVPVVACADRYRAGKMALAKFKADAVILDDGFQHVSLERQGEIVLVDATKPLGGLRQFPRGSLREPVSALAQAHLIIVTRCDQDRRSARMAASLAKRFPHTTVVRSNFVPRDVLLLQSGKAVPLKTLRDARVVAASAVGNPKSFRRSLKSVGANVVRHIDMADHQRPTWKDLMAWDALRRRADADYVVVTEKDAVKLRELGKMPPEFLVLRIAFRFATDGDREAAERVLHARLRMGRVRGYLTS